MIYYYDGNVACCVLGLSLHNAGRALRHIHGDLQLAFDRVLQNHMQHPNQPITKCSESLLDAFAYALIEADEAPDDISRAQRGLQLFQ